MNLNRVFVGPVLWVNPKQGIFDLKAADTGGVHVLRSKVSSQQAGGMQPPALSRPMRFLPCAPIQKYIYIAPRILRKKVDSLLRLLREALSVRSNDDTMPYYIIRDQFCY